MLAERGCRQPTPDESHTSGSLPADPYSPLWRFICFLLTFMVIALTLFQLVCPFVTCHPPPTAWPSRFINPPAPYSSVSQTLDKIPSFFLLNSSITSSCKLKLSSRVSCQFFIFLLLLAGDIEINPGPVSASHSLIIANLNIRSATSITPQYHKPELLQNLVLDNKIDLLCLTETWLPPSPLQATITSLTPPGYSFTHCPRPQGRGGGLGFLIGPNLVYKPTALPSFPSFESQCISITPSTSKSSKFSSTSVSMLSYTIVNIYRPPSLSKTAFISDFTTLLEGLISTPSEIVITGDFNFHCDQPTDPTVSPFLELLDVFGLKQHITFPTHDSGHTLDLIITRATSSFVSSSSSSFTPISDHLLILSNFSIPVKSRPTRIMKTTRPINKIDTEQFSKDIFASVLYSSPATTLAAYVQQFSETLTTLLDKHAPLKTSSCPSTPSKPFITPEIRREKSKRSRLESIFRSTKSQTDKENYKAQARVVSKMITASRRQYFRTFISSCSQQPRKLWSAFNNLLSRKPPPTLPNAASSSTLADSFLKFFNDKITKLCSVLPSPASVPTHVLHPPPPFPPPPLLNLSPASQDEVRRVILSSSNSTCPLDPIPTKLIKSCLDSLLAPITTLINLSLSEGTFPTSFKSPLVKPLLKKYSLPRDDLASYRPISNLNFVSKTLERIIHNRLNDHLQSFPSICPFQSAYRKFHSTETALLRIQNDLLLAMNKQKLSALVLLDLSAAFDTIDHNILLARLSSTFGISGSALSLLSSYLLDRSQSVSINSHCTPPSPMETGVPQGSVLGPLLFCLYTTPLSYIFSNSSVSFHLYADDTQLYISFSSSDSHDSLASLSSTLDSVYTWLTTNRLSVNPSKTEYLIIGTWQQRAKLTSSSLIFNGTPLTPTDSARNLGVIFDQDLSMKKHISSICQTSFYHIRQLRQVRSSLDTNSTMILANSLVSTKLDYCNSLFYGLPASSLNRLQRVQNALARVVVPSVKRHHHISPTLKDLHWLPIKQRIDFKIASITFKTLQNRQPTYLFELLTPHVPSSNLRSSNKHLLVTPTITSENGRRAFSFSAPTVWNSLPLHLRSCTSQPIFLSGLKTHLFPP